MQQSVEIRQRSNERQYATGNQKHMHLVCTQNAAHLPLSRVLSALHSLVNAPISSAKMPPRNGECSCAIIHVRLSRWKGKRGSRRDAGCGASIKHRSSSRSTSGGTSSSTSILRCHQPSIGRAASPSRTSSAAEESLITTTPSSALLSSSIPNDFVTTGLFAPSDFHIRHFKLHASTAMQTQALSATSASGTWLVRCCGVTWARDRRNYDCPVRIETWHTRRQTQ